jgi:DNA integrity scanning protein DisA with diadenylate cyclase activity
MLDSAVRMAEAYNADALLIMVDAPNDWESIVNAAKPHDVIVVAERPEDLEGAKEVGLDTVHLDVQQSPVLEKLTQALLESVVADLLAPGADVVAVYSGFEAGRIDSVSIIHLDEHLRRLTARDLRQLETSVPLDTLKTVVDLAVEIGREGREGKPVGTMFVVGSPRAVMERCHATTFDPVKGYKKNDRNLNDLRVREGIKEIAQMDGAFVVSPDGTVVAAAQYVDASADGLTLSKGLGARHWAAAAISRKTAAVAVTVSESNGTVRIFQNGDVVLRIEPFRLPMKWKEFEFEPPAAE